VEGLRYVSMHARLRLDDVMQMAVAASLVADGV
jgi:hypothetical protein